MPDRATEQFGERVLRLVVEVVLVAKEDDPVCEQRRPDRLDVVLGEVAVEPDAVELSADAAGVLEVSEGGGQLTTVVAHATVVE
jgi:hypothetical protein